MADVTPVRLFVNHVEIVNVEWEMTTEEILGGKGRARLVVQDRTNTWEPQPHWDVKAIRRSDSWVMFRGEIINEPVELPVGMPFRKWQLDCVDYSDQFPQRLIGAFDGVTWQDVDGLGDYVNIDPFAHSLATDKLTIQALFDRYIRVDGEAINTTEFVGEYLTDFGPIFWAYSNLQRALEELAGYIAANLQFWLDPDLKLHWITVPAWQELAQQAAALIAAPTSGGLAALMPSVVVERLQTSEADISDVPGAGEVGGRNLKFTFDGSDMPQQIYVRGSTGFVYNAPAVNPAGETVTINPEGYGSKSTDKFRLTFLSTTKVWRKGSNGLLDGTFVNHASGGPYEVEFIKVPYNSANGKGGHFWKLNTGPHVGYLVDNDTNYFNYGDILVEKYVVTVTEPQVGVGGSGWVNAVTQDPNKRQAYLEAGISSTEAIRDSFGGQALYRASFPTLRGSVTVDNRGPSDEGDGTESWRVGQLVKITDARLPATLNGEYFIIQRVATSLLAETNIREYTIDWGDGPTSRYTADEKPGGGDEVTWPPPAVMVIIEAFDLSPGPNSSQVIVGQLANKAGGPWEIGGKVVKWALEAYTSPGGALVPGQGTLTPEASATDSHGRARTTLKTGPMAGLVYFVFADVTVI